MNRKPIPVPDTVDKSNWTGKDFEFLLVGNIQISENEYDLVMAPNFFDWKKLTLNKWSTYNVGQESVCFSHDIHGIQMIFSKTIQYIIARQIVDEILENIREAGHSANLVVFRKAKCIFEDKVKRSTHNALPKFGA